MWHERSYLWLLIGLLGFTPEAMADALECYRAGTAAMKVDDFAAAAEAFRDSAGEASCADVRDGLLFNEAVALDKLAEASDTSSDDRPICQALYAYRRALPVARAATRPAIEDGIARLAPRCPPAGALRIVCEPAGGTVALDDRQRKQPCPAQFDDLRPGTWRGQVTAAGRAVRFEVEVPTGQRVEHRVVLRAPEPPSDPEPAKGEGHLSEPALAVDESTDGSSGAGPAPYGWAALALGAASAGVATYAYAASLSVAEDGEAAITRMDRAGFAEARSEYDDLETLHRYTTIAAAALITTGAVLLYVDADDDGAVSTIEPIIGPVSGVRIRFWP